MKASIQHLKNSKRILFYLQLAIGDYTYFRTFLKKLKELYPQLLIDLFLYEPISINHFKKNNQNQTIYNWLKTESFINKVYCNNFTLNILKNSLDKAKEKHYDIIISLDANRNYEITKNCLYIANPNTKTYALDILRFYNFTNKKIEKQLTNTLQVEPKNKNNDFHISDQYNFLFKQFAGFYLNEEEKKPKLSIPPNWIAWGQEEISALTSSFQKKIFLNIYAKNHKRSWTLDKAFQLILHLRALDSFKNAYFFINTIPNQLDEVTQDIKNTQLKNIKSFSAIDNFYQLPAMLQQMDLVISVDTAIVHLASALDKPIISLMRKRKKTKWKPLNKHNSKIIYNRRYKDYIADLSVKDVFEGIKNFSFN